MNMKKVLVTGASGFIGNHVIKNLISKRYNIIATSSNIKKASNFSWFKKVEYIPLNFADLDLHVNYFDLFQKPDAVIHLSWEGLPNYKDDFHLETNLPRQKYFLENLLKNGLKNLTVTGTCFEYGMQQGCLSEDMKAKPNTPYATAKNILREHLSDLSAGYLNFHLKWIRLFYMYGEGQNPKSLLSQLQKALNENQTVFNMSGGEQTRDFLPVETVADYIVEIAAQEKVTGIINCCSGQPVTVKDFVEKYLKEHKEKKIYLNFGYYPYADYEPMHFWGDNSRQKQIINRKK